MAKQKKKDRWTLLAETAVELNEVLGLEPPIETNEVSEIELEEKLQEASALITPEDDFTAQTEGILAEFKHSREEPADTEQPEAEAEEDEQVYSYEEIREHVDSLKKRKDLRVFAEEFPEVFEPIIEQLADIKSGAKLKEAMLERMDALLEGEEEVEETEQAPSSDDMSAKEAISHIEETPLEELEGFMHPEEKRGSVRKAWEAKQELAEAEEEVEEKLEKKPKKKKKGRGVIATIASTIEDAGKEGVSKEEILEVLTEQFPNRDADSMSNTINVQVPTRISKERFNVERNDDGKYYKTK